MVFFFVISLFLLFFLATFFLTFYKTLLYLQYSTGLSNDTSLTIIYW